MTLLLMMLHNHTKFDMHFRRYYLTFTNILNLCCDDLDLEHRTQFLHRTILLMMLYYQTKFGCKWTSSSEDIVEIVIFLLYKPRCDLDIE